MISCAKDGGRSRAILLTTSEKLACETMAQVERLLPILPTADWLQSAGATSGR
jgi:sulfopropanediol 3-dehydrogenase